jgi:hypothetical protein
MSSSGLLPRVALVRTDVSEERIASIIKVTRVFLRSVLRLLVTANISNSPILINLMMKAILSSETSILIRAIKRNIPEDETDQISESSNFPVF